MALAPRSALEVFHAPNNVCILQAIEVLYAECGSIQIDIPRKPFVDVQPDYIVITPSFPAPPAPTNWNGLPNGPPNPGEYVPNTLVPVFSTPCDDDINGPPRPTVFAPGFPGANNEVNLNGANDGGGGGNGNGNFGGNGGGNGGFTGGFSGQANGQANGRGQGNGQGSGNGNGNGGGNCNGNGNGNGNRNTGDCPPTISVIVDLADLDIDTKVYLGLLGRTVTNLVNGLLGAIGLGGNNNQQVTQTFASNCGLSLAGLANAQTSDATTAEQCLRDCVEDGAILSAKVGTLNVCLGALLTGGVDVDACVCFTGARGALLDVDAGVAQSSSNSFIDITVDL